MPRAATNLAYLAAEGVVVRAVDDLRHRVSPMQRAGWWSLLAIALTAAALNIVLLGTRTVEAITDGSAGDALGSLPILVLAGLFWRWVIRDVWERARPRVDPETGATKTSEEVGPWGVVGRVLIALMVLGGSLLAWGASELEQDLRPARRAAERAEVQARRSDLTYDQVAKMVGSHRTGDDPTGSDGASKELDELLGLDDARVVDVAVGDAGVAIFVRPAGSPACGVLVIDRDDLRSTRTSSTC